MAISQSYSRTDFSATGTVAQQTLTFSDTPDEGGFVIERNDGAKTSLLAFDANAATVQAALRLLSGYGSITVSGSPGAQTITFTGVNGPVPLLSALSSMTTAGEPVDITPEETTPGEIEVQTLDFSAVSTAGSYKLNFAATPTGDIAWDATAGDIQTEVRTLPGLSAATVTGTAATSVVITFAGYAGDAALLTVSDNTLEDTNTDPVDITVEETNKGVIEVQTILFSDVSVSGEYVLNYDGDDTGSIPSGTDATGLETELQGISGLESVTVTGDEETGFVITFDGVAGDLPLITVTSNTLVSSGGDPVDVDFVTTVPGVGTSQCTDVIYAEVVAALAYGTSQIQYYNSSTKELILYVGDAGSEQAICLIPPATVLTTLKPVLPGGSRLSIRAAASATTVNSGVLDINYVRGY